MIMEAKILHVLNYNINKVTIIEQLESLFSIYHLDKRHLEKAMIFSFLYLLENI